MAWSELLEIPYDKPPYYFDLHVLGDMQMGSKSCIQELIEMWVERIVAEAKHRDSGVLITGDIEDEDRPSTRVIRRASFAGRPEVEERDAQKHMAWVSRDVVPKLLPLQKTKYGIVGILAGHHWTQLTPVLNSAQFIAMELERLSGKRVPYLGEMSSFLDLRFKNKTWGVTLRRVGHVQHGEGGGMARGSALRKLDRAHQGFIADFYARGHDCQIEAAKFDQLYPAERRAGGVPHLLAKNIAVMNIGSATRGYEVTKGPPSYPEHGMMRPTAIGWGTLHFEVRVARQFEDPNRGLKTDIRVTI